MDIPVSVVIALGVQQLCQFLKFVPYSIPDPRIAPRYFITSGGMPSAHSAFVTALCVAVAVRGGLASEVFSVTLVLAFIVIHDALRVRGTLQQIIGILKSDNPDPDSPAADLPDTIGHNAPEVIAGILFGITAGLPAAILTRGF